MTTIEIDDLLDEVRTLAPPRTFPADPLRA